MIRSSALLPLFPALLAAACPQAVGFSLADLFQPRPKVSGECRVPVSPAPPFGRWFVAGGLPASSVRGDRLFPRIGAQIDRTGQDEPEPGRAELSLTRALGLRVRRIAIDAGHGGRDYGTSGPRGLLEKDATLDIALRTARLLRGLGFAVVLTRENDSFIPLRRRTTIANESGADLFLSIHANSSPRAGTSGPETWYLNFNSDPAALAVAERENLGAGEGVGSLHNLIQEIALNDKVAESEAFARALQQAVFSTTARSGARVHDRGTKRAPFMVLIGAAMPAVLAEVGFLSNPGDESRLGRADYRQTIADALSDGVRSYVRSLENVELAKRVDLALQQPAAELR